MVDHLGILLHFDFLQVLGSHLQDNKRFKNMVDAQSMIPLNI